jgi:poly(A) polymerase
MNFKADLDHLEIFKKVGACADQLGVDTYVVGGYVRDIIVKR